MKDIGKTAKESLFFAAFAAIFFAAAIWTSTGTASPYEPHRKWVEATNVTASTNEATPSMRPGQLIWDLDSGKTYMYVKFDNGAGNVAVDAGDPAYVKTLATYVVTTDISDSITAQGNSVCGVFVSAPTDGYYCVIQVLGPASIDTDGDDDIVAGDAIIAQADSVIESIASGTQFTNKILGFAVAADDNTADTVDAWVTVGAW